MGIIDIDEKLQVSDDLADLIIGLITLARTKLPKVSIQSLLLAKTRPGLDPDVVTSTITSRFAEAGIPTGPLSDGSPNSMEILAGIFCDEIFSAINEDGRIDLMVDGGQQSLGFGANAGGPVSVVSTNITPWLGTGVCV